MKSRGIQPDAGWLELYSDQRLFIKYGGFSYRPECKNLTVRHIVLLHMC